MALVDIDSLGDRLRIAFAGRFDVCARPAARDALIELLASSGDLRPERMVASFLQPVRSEKAAFSPAALEAAMVSPELPGSVWLEGPGAEWQLGFLPEASGVGTTITLDSREALRDRDDRLPSLVVRLVNALGLQFVVGDRYSELSLRREKKLRDRSTAPHLREIYWLNAYPRSFVECIGRARFESAPAYDLRELPGGGILLRTVEAPPLPTDPDALRARARLRAHLCDGVAFEPELERLQKKADALEPVECRWDRTVDDLLASIARAHGVVDGLRFVRRMREFRPPVVRDQAPLSKLAAPDVEDEAAAIDDYLERAEVISAFLHREYRALRPLPELVHLVDQRSPAALPLLDFHLWESRYDEYMDRAQRESMLIPCLGAFLGEILVRHLSGRWVPRRAASELQVVAAGRVWFPVRRVERCLGGKKATLKYSMTQFYRAAEEAARREPPTDA